MTTSSFLRPAFRYHSDKGDIVALGVHGHLLIATVPVARYKFAEPGITMVLPLSEVLDPENAHSNVLLRWDEIENLRHHLSETPKLFDLERVKLSRGRDFYIPLPTLKSGSDR